MKNIALTLALILLPITAHASAVAPTQCPSVAAIQSTKFWIEKERGDEDFYAIQENKNYDSTEPTSEWTFYLRRIKAASLEQAYHNANLALDTLNFKNGPSRGPFRGSYLCNYEVGFGYSAYAMTGYPWDM